MKHSWYLKTSITICTLLININAQSANPKKPKTLVTTRWYAALPGPLRIAALATVVKRRNGFEFALRDPNSSVSQAEADLGLADLIRAGQAHVELREDNYTTRMNDDLELMDQAGLVPRAEQLNAMTRYATTEERNLKELRIRIGENRRKLRQYLGNSKKSNNDFSEDDQSDSDHEESKQSKDMLFSRKIKGLVNEALKNGTPEHLHSTLLFRALSDAQGNNIFVNPETLRAMSNWCKNTKAQIKQLETLSEKLLELTLKRYQSPQEREKENPKISVPKRPSPLDLQEKKQPERSYPRTPKLEKLHQAKPAFTALPNDHEARNELGDKQPEKKPKIFVGIPVQKKKKPRSPRHPRPKQKEPVHAGDAEDLP